MTNSESESKTFRSGIPTIGDHIRASHEQAIAAAVAAERERNAKVRAILERIPDMLPAGYEALAREIETVLKECE